MPPDLSAPEGENADPACFVHLGVASALSVNGLFSDPSLQIRLPDGREADTSELAADLMEQELARRLIYATDLANTQENRARLCSLAKGADALFCEAGFAEADAEQARRTGHLTARACGEIAVAARVKRLIPLRFSRRYESDPNVVYSEVKTALEKAPIEIRTTPVGSRSIALASDH